MAVLDNLVPADEHFQQTETRHFHHREIRIRSCFIYFIRANTTGLHRIVEV